jgi:hypothetical protein
MQVVSRIRQRRGNTRLFSRMTKHMALVTVAFERLGESLAFNTDDRTWWTFNQQ